MEQVLTIAKENDTTLPILVGYLHSFAYLQTLAEVLASALTPTGTYFVFCNNIDLLAKYSVTIKGVKFYVLPCDEFTVWKEMLDLLQIDKNDIKKLDVGGKLQEVLDNAKDFPENYEPITFEQGLILMEPVKNRNENRPV